jgi:hypothetical protein
VVINKALPDLFLDRGAKERAERLCREAQSLAEEVAATVPLVGDAAQLARVLGELGESFVNFHVVAAREAEQRSELSGHAEVVATVPFTDHDITDLAGLFELGESLWR